MNQSKPDGYLKFMMYSVLGVLALTAGFNYANHTSKPPNPDVKPAIFKIGSAGNPTCTAFVIDDTHALTAEHCVQAQVFLSFFAPIPTIDVLTDDDQVLHKDVKVIHTRDARIDLALLVGDFSKHLKLSQNTHGIELDEKDNFLACGYPYGTKELVCSKVHPYENYMHMYKARGYMVYGFSGGPVINITKGVVVAVNTALTEDFIIITPITGLRGLFNLP